MIFNFLIGYLIVQTICLIWFYSPLRVSLGQIFFDKKIHTTDEFDTHLMIKSMFFSKLLSCYICFSFWTSLVVGGIGCFLLYIPLYFAFLAQLTYPSICFLYKLHIDSHFTK
jgi:hypothetical protein